MPFYAGALKALKTGFRNLVWVLEVGYGRSVNDRAVVCLKRFE